MYKISDILLSCYINGVMYWYCLSQWPRGLRRGYSAARLLRSWVRILPGAWMSVCFECCVLSGRGLCDELIIRSEQSYRLWRVVVWLRNLENQEAKTRYRAVKNTTTMGCNARKTKKKNKQCIDIIIIIIIIIIIGIQPLGRSGQRPEFSQATGMALVRCIQGKFLGVACHCFPPLF